MNNPNAYKEEQIGRSIYQKLADQIGWQVEYTKEQFNPIDLHLQIQKNEQIYTASGEIKNRAKTALKFQTHIITLHKIRHLVADKKDFALFINIIGDNIFIYDCNKLVRQIKNGQLKPYKKYLPNKNMTGTSYHWEYIVEVDKDTAIHFKKENGQWNKIPNKIQL